MTSREAIASKNIDKSKSYGLHNFYRGSLAKNVKNCQIWKNVSDWVSEDVTSREAMPLKTSLSEWVSDWVREDLTSREAIWQRMKRIVKFEKTSVTELLTEWLSEWVREDVTSREAIASKNISKIVRRQQKRRIVYTRTNTLVDQNKSQTFKTYKSVVFFNHMQSRSDAIACTILHNFARLGKSCQDLAARLGKTWQDLARLD